LRCLAPKNWGTLAGGSRNTFFVFVQSARLPDDFASHANAVLLIGGRRKAKPGRPAVSVETERLVLQFARENPGWGYDRIVGALANLGHRTADQTIGNILMRHGLGPAPERKRHTTWTEFIRQHKAVLWATDFFTAEVWTSTGLTTC
jgi:hypothetical protein